MRIKDPDLLKLLRIQATECALSGATSRLSLHHIYPRGQGGDDVRANIVVLEGDGVSGVHGQIEHKHPDTLAALHMHILHERPDTIEYLDAKLGSLDRALAWMERTYTMRDQHV